MKISKTFLAIFVVVLISVLTWFVTSQLVKQTSTNHIPSQSETQEQKPEAKIVATSNAKPLDLITSTKKSVSGVFKQLSDDTIVLTNAYEDASFKLGPINGAVLNIFKKRLDPKQPPEVPDHQFVPLSQLATGDQVLLTIEDKGEGFVVTEVIVSRER